MVKYTILYFCVNAILCIRSALASNIRELQNVTTSNLENMEIEKSKYLADMASWAKNTEKLAELDKLLADLQTGNLVLEPKNPVDF